MNLRTNIDYIARAWAPYGPCDECGVVAGAPCWNLHTTRAHLDYWELKQTPHPGRPSHGQFRPGGPALRKDTEWPRLMGLPRLL